MTQTSWRFTPSNSTSRIRRFDISYSPVYLSASAIIRYTSSIIAYLCIALLALLVHRLPAVSAMQEYNNICLSLTTQSTPDPHITYAHNQFFLTFTAGNRVEIWRARSLPDFQHNADKHVVWHPPPNTHHSADLWAPELHALQGRWYIYYAAAHPHHGNKSHRMYILGGPPAHTDPTQGQWTFLGPIAGIKDHWAIDGTIIELNRTLYFVYSGWPFNNPSESDLIQNLFIVRLRGPVTADSPSCLLSEPTQHWERTGDHGINEGPQALTSQDDSWTGIVYSCAGSWTKDYKENTLQYIGGDPLDQSSWRKGTAPFLTNNDRGRGPWGPGHGSFLHVGEETVHVYHATDGERDGWGNRKARLQRVVFRGGQPFMGGVVGPLTSDYREFLGGSVGAGHGHGHGHGHEEGKKHGLKGMLQRIKDEL